MDAPRDPPPVRVAAARPPVPLSATLLAALCGAGMLCAMCAGGVVLAIAHTKEPRLARARARRIEAAEQRGRVTDAKSLLDVMAARIAAKSAPDGELPESLDEAPPRDPWGHPVEYRLLAPDTAQLRSAGPDGEFGTKDDVRRDVEAR